MGYPTVQKCIVTALYTGQTLRQHILIFLGHCVHERGKKKKKITVSIHEH